MSSYEARDELLVPFETFQAIGYASEPESLPAFVIIWF